jgi:hypothetical protein
VWRPVALWLVATAGLTLGAVAWLAFQVMVSRTLVHEGAGGGTEREFLMWLVRNPTVLHDKSFGMISVEAFSRTCMALAGALFVASHAVPCLMPRRRVRVQTALTFGGGSWYRELPPSERVVTNSGALRGAAVAQLRVEAAWATALSAGIWLLGYYNVHRGAVHEAGGCLSWGNPVEAGAYFALSVACLLSHAPRLFGWTASRLRACDTTSPS